MKTNVKQARQSKKASLGCLAIMLMAFLCFDAGLAKASTLPAGDSLTDSRGNRAAAWSGTLKKNTTYELYSTYANGNPLDPGSFRVVCPNDNTFNGQIYTEIGNLNSATSQSDSEWTVIDFHTTQPVYQSGVVEIKDGGRIRMRLRVPSDTVTILRTSGNDCMFKNCKSDSNYNGWLRIFGYDEDHKFIIDGGVVFNIPYDARSGYKSGLTTGGYLIYNKNNLDVMDKYKAKIFGNCYVCKG